MNETAICSGCGQTVRAGLIDIYGICDECEPLTEREQVVILMAAADELRRLRMDPNAIRAAFRPQR